MQDYLVVNEDYKTVQLNWNNLVSKVQNIDDFLELVKMITNITDKEKYKSFVKWKDIDNHVLIKSKNYFYKIYQCDYKTGVYSCEIRKRLADIYKRKFGIVWNVVTIEQDNMIYQLEQRERLELCTDNIRFEDILLDWSYTLDELEKELRFEYILKQLQKNNFYKGIYNIKLLRENANKFLDYAYTPDKKHFVLLDDSDFFIALLDKNNQWISLPRHSCEIETTKGNLYFTPKEQDKVGECTSGINYQWFIIDYYTDPNEENKKFRSLKHKMLEENLYILTTHSIKDNSNLYSLSGYDDWGNLPKNLLNEK